MSTDVPVNFEEVSTQVPISDVGVYNVTLDQGFPLLPLLFVVALA
jgi:hypothetical protein